MIQQINLYQGSTRKSVPVFGANHLIKGSLGLVVVVIVMTSIGMWQTSTLRSSVEDSRNRLQALTTETEALKAEYPEIPVDSGLQEKLADSRRLIDAMRKFLDYLTDSQSARAQGFSTYFEGLARHKIPKLWFSGVTVTDGGVNLKLAGTTLLPERVPKLLQLLRAEPAFRGKLFGSLVMEKQEDGSGRVNFSIDTKVLEDADHGGA